MKGYKAFGKGMVCMGKQYSENTIFEEPKAEICRSGIHFCKNPFDVLNYYSLIDRDGDIIEVAEVESLDTEKTNDNRKFCTKKIRIGKKLNLRQFIEAGIGFLVGENFSDYDNSDYANIESSEDNARIGSSGYHAFICSNGYNAQIGSSGDGVRICTNGDSAKICSSGDDVCIGSSSDYAKIGTIGNYARIGLSGENIDVCSSGDFANISSSGYGTRINSIGNFANISSSGNLAKINSSGYGSIIAVLGEDGTAKASVGSWITLAEYAWNGTNSAVKCVKTEFVDGERIKGNTWYQLVNGEFKEIK